MWITIFKIIAPGVTVNELRVQLQSFENNYFNTFSKAFKFDGDAAFFPSAV